MTAARRHRASRSETPIVGAEGEPGHKQTPSLATSPSLPLADRTRTIRMMAQAPLGASAPSCFIGTPFISCGSHFSHRRFFAHSNRNQPHPNITNQRPVTAGGAYPPVQRAHCRQTQQLYIHRPERPRTPFLISLEFQRFQELRRCTTVGAIVFNGCCTDSAPYNARIMPFRGSCTRIGVATLRASCAASHSHAGPHRARNEPSGGVNEIRNTTGSSSMIVGPHRHD